MEDEVVIDQYGRQYVTELDQLLTDVQTLAILARASEQEALAVGAYAASNFWELRALAFEIAVKQTEDELVVMRHSA